MKVNILLSTYNGEQYLKEQVKSIQDQTYQDWQLLIRDDGSTDGTVEIIQELVAQDERIRFINQGAIENLGVIKSFHTLLKYEKADLYCFSDQDDVWLPDKVESMLQYLLQYDLVVSDCKVVDAELNVISQSFFMGRSSGKGFWKNLIKNTYLGCCIAFRKEVLGYILPFPRNIAMHDIWIGLSVEMHSNSFFLPRQLILYRRHGSNVSFGGEGSKYSLMYKIKYRLCMLFYLLKRKYLNK